MTMLVWTICSNKPTAASRPAVTAALSSRAIIEYVTANATNVKIAATRYIH